MKSIFYKLREIIPYACRYGLGPMRTRHKLLGCSQSLETKNFSQGSYFSQNGQDQFFINELFAGNSDGFFVDIGANDGITFSNTYALELKGWRGLCIEPHPDVFEQLRRNRTCECICAAAAASNTAASFEFWKISADRIENCMLSGFPEFMNSFQIDRIQRLLASGDVTRENIHVPFMSVGDYLVQSKKTDPDLVCIDVEGAEWQILADLCDKRVKPRAFCIENNELHYKLSYEMYRRGYALKAIKGGDEIYALM